MIDLKKYLDEFNRLSKLSCSCVSYVDSSADLDAKPDTYFTITFFLITEFKRHEITYQEKGEYRSMPEVYGGNKGFVFEDGDLKTLSPTGIKDGFLQLEYYCIDFHLDPTEVDFCLDSYL